MSINNYKLYEYDECKPIKGSFYPGKYKIEAWGAGVGQSAKGAYASGILKVKSITPFFVHLGSSPTRGNPSAGGCNGGGIGASYFSTQLFGGGGSTDIRLLKDTIYHRIVVAGGAGGCNTLRNACGGGCVETYSCKMNNGSFFYGGDSQPDPENGNGAGGGGGGWFGGAASCLHTSSTWYCGNGGSSYVLTQTSERVEGYKLSDRKDFYLESAVLINGATSMPSPKSSENEIGHSGHGTLKITMLSFDLFNSVLRCTMRVTCSKYGILHYIVTLVMC